jgi:hypothetical protein
MPLSLPALLLSAALRLLAPAPPTAATLSGHLDHAPAGDTVRLAYGPHQGGQRLRAVLSPAGDFRVTVPDLKTGTPVDFYYVRQHASLYLRPGDDVRMTLDFPKFDESLRFSGRGADANNYLA